MKEWIKKWLGIDSMLNAAKAALTTHADEEIARIQNTEKAFLDVLTQYSWTTCSVCKKEILAHYGGFYRNHKGEVFCSHKCIDKSLQGNKGE